MTRFSSSFRPIWSRPLLFLYLLFFGLILLCFDDYGVTNDEDGLRLYGNAILAWYYTGFTNTIVLNYADLKYYGGFFEVVAQLVTIPVLYLGYDGIFEVRHLVNALFGLLGLVYVGRIAGLLGGPAAAFWAVLFLLLTPRYFGHSFNNPKDLPFAALQIAALFHLLRLGRYAPHVSRLDLVAFGLFWGCALGIRVGAVLIGLYAVAFLAVGMRHRSGLWASVLDAEWRRYWFYLALAALLAYLTMLVFWPYAQTNPLGAPLESIQVMTRFPWKRVTFFNGYDYVAGTLPFYYIPVWLLITLPEFYFIIFLAWLLHRGRRLFTSSSSNPSHAIYLLLCFAFFPLALAMLMGSILYDGLRHFLFVLPVLAILAGLAFERLRRAFAERKIRIALLGAVLASGALTAYDMADLHPFQTVYFNRAVAGGLPYAARRFETDYWGNGYRAAGEWIQANYSHRTSENPVRILSCDIFLPMEYQLNRASFARDEKELLRRYFEMDGSPLEKFLFRDLEGPFHNYDFGWIREPDLFVTTTRFHCHRRIQGRVVHTIERKGVPLVYILEPRPIPPGMKDVIHHRPLYPPGLRRAE